MKYNILATAFSFLLVGLALFTPAGIAFAERLVPCDGPDCNLCQLAQLAENIVNFYVKIAFVAAALLFTVAGFMFFTGGADPTKITNAKKIFTNTFVGIIIILTSWLVVNVLLTTLMGEGVNPFTDRVFCAEVQTTSTTPTDDSGGGITAEPVDTPNPEEYIFEVQNPDGTFDTHIFSNFEECSAAQSSTANVVFTCSGEDLGATPRPIDDPRGYTFEVRNVDGTYENFIFPTIVECARAQSGIDPSIGQVVFTCSGINLEE